MTWACHEVLLLVWMSITFRERTFTFWGVFQVDLPIAKLREQPVACPQENIIALSEIRRECKLLPPTQNIQQQERSEQVFERCCCLMCVYLVIIISTVFRLTDPQSSFSYLGLRSSFSQHSISTYVTAAAGQYSVKLGKLQASQDQFLKLKDHLSAQFSHEIRQLFMKEHSSVIMFVSVLKCDRSKVNNFDWRFLCKRITRSFSESMFI